MASASRQSDNEKWSNYSFGIDHIFNLSTAFAGYILIVCSRFLRLKGWGYISLLWLERKKSGRFPSWLQMKLATGTRLDVFVEPAISFYTDNIDISGENNWHGYDMGFNAVWG